MRRTTTSLLTILTLLPGFCFAEAYYGANASIPLITKEPASLRGYQLMLNYDPQRFKWNKFNVYFDGGFSYFSVSDTTYYTAMNIYSIAPVVRYTFNRQGLVSPFLELSVGLSYLNHTHLQNRNLGMHFAFQDRVGFGALLGASERYTVGFHAVHYSNAHLSSHNSGITIPLMLDLGIRF